MSVADSVGSKFMTDDVAKIVPHARSWIALKFPKIRDFVELVSSAWLASRHPRTIEGRRYEAFSGASDASEYDASRFSRALSFSMRSFQWTPGGDPSSQ